MPNEHSSKQFEQDLQSVHSKVLLMGGLAENHLRDALACFQSGNGKHAEQVMQSDEAVNQLEISLDDACVHLIVRRQPAANDLRMVIATLKIITDLERIGDEATKIARAAMSIQQRGANSFSPYNIIKTIADYTAEMLHDALDAFARLDDQHAAEIIARDTLIDHEFQAIMRSLITFMMEDPRTISTALNTLWAAKAIERIGDHATNIAEYVVYVVEGKDIRHSHSPIAGASDVP